MRTTGLKKKFNIILSHEETIARSVALSVLKPKKISVWEMLIPIIFIFGYMKSKEQREAFAQNLLFTKKMALQAAFDMLKRNQNRTDVWQRVLSQTRELLDSVADGIYSDDIRQAQLKEMDLLFEHFRRLLDSRGSDYGSMAREVYQTLDNYTVFLKRLRQAEDNVARAARRTLGKRADIRTLDQIEAAGKRIRNRQAEKIFLTDPG